MPLRLTVPIVEPEGSSFTAALPVSGNARLRRTVRTACPSGFVTAISRPQRKVRARSSTVPSSSEMSYSRHARPSTEVLRVASQITSACSRSIAARSMTAKLASCTAGTTASSSTHRSNA
jgi:hypothetical protein